jgi:hypothetical protein
MLDGMFVSGTSPSSSFLSMKLMLPALFMSSSLSVKTEARAVSLAMDRR